MSLLLSYAPSPGTSKELVLKGGTNYTIGRKPECDLVLKQDKVSGKHARLFHLNPDQWFIEDLNSTNGTFLDGVRVVGRVRIEKPSTIRFGPSGPLIRVQAKNESKVQTVIQSKTVSNPNISYPTASKSKTELLIGLILGLLMVISASIYSVNKINTTVAQIPPNPNKKNSVPSKSEKNKKDDVPADSSQSKEVDAAAEIAGHINYFADPSHPALNDEEQYRKGIGDMARIQAEKMVSQNQSRNFPTIVIGRQQTRKCNDTENSAGVYNPKCHEILVAFDSNLRYDYPIEVLYVLAHEYSHHLLEVTLGSSKISALDNELTADCFAGYMAGYWNTKGKLTEEEQKRGQEVMETVGKSEPRDMNDSHGDPGQREGAFLGGFARAQGNVNQQYQNFCRTLDRILKL